MILMFLRLHKCTFYLYVQTSLESQFCVELNTKSPEKWAEKLFFGGLEEKYCLT